MFREVRNDGGQISGGKLWPIPAEMPAGLGMKATDGMRSAQERILDKEEAKIMDSKNPGSHLAGVASREPVRE